MDRLAAAGVRFEDAHAHNVVTLASHANILSGRYPTDHGVRDNSGFRFPAGIEPLATTLQARGYATGAFGSAFPLASRFGLARGFDVCDDSFVDAEARPAFLEQERRGPETVALAQRWMGAHADRPFFCWVHLYEPHAPYAPAEPFATRFRSAPYQGEVAPGRTGYFAPWAGTLSRAGAPLHGFIRDQEKSLDPPTPELSDLRQDPSEVRTRAAAEPQQLEALRALLAPLRSADRGIQRTPE